MTDMNTRILARATPGLFAVALLALVGATPAPPQFGYPTYYPAPCTTYSQASAGSNTTLFAGGDGVIQPLLTMNTLAACSLRVAGNGWSYATVTVREWDPVALAPDPATVALRLEALDPSGMDYYAANRIPWMRLDPPIVTRSVAGVAEPPRTTLSVEARAMPSVYGASLTGYYEPNGDVALPAGGTIAGGGGHQPLTGAHPVFAHALCEGDDDLQSLAIGQCVRETDTRFSSLPMEFLQRFNVPEPIEVRWVELAFGEPGSPRAVTSDPMPAPSLAQVAIVEDVAGGTPPVDLPPALALGTLDSFFGYADYVVPSLRWRSHPSFDVPVLLQPGHDYWLHITSASNAEFSGHTLTGSEGPAFAAGIGSLHTRGIPSEAWTPVAGQTLAFKLVGRPTAPLSAGHPPTSAGSILLAIAPNPASGAASITWSGAVGPVRFEVFDARGRRVATSEGGAAGTWSWAMSGGDGRPLPAGVYLVHARDSAGGHSVRRIVVYH